MKEKKTKAATAHASRKFAFSKSELRFLKKLGLHIHRELYKQNKTVERLSSDLGISRSTLREIIAGRSNARIITMKAIAEGLGYDSLFEFIKPLE